MIYIYIYIYIYTFLKKPLEFIYLSLYPQKTSFHPWKFHKFLLHPLEIPRPKIQDQWKIHMTFLITPRKSTSFLIDSGISACFFQYPLKFHVLNSPYLFFFWNRVVIENVFGQHHFKRNQERVDKKIPDFVIFYAETIKNNCFFEKR